MASVQDAISTRSQRDDNSDKTRIAQKKPQLTHFLSVPIVTPASRPVLERSLQRFRTGLSSIEDERAGDDVSKVIDDRAVRPVGTLHLTLGVMSLKEAEKLQQAKQLLNELDIGSMLAQPSSTATPPPPLSIDLHGLSSMHNPSKTSVLYTDPKDSTNRLLPFCERLRGEFLKHGLLVDDNRPLKLHVTIVNTRHVKWRKSDGAREEKERGDRRRRPGPIQIDARLILERFRDFVWAEDVLLDRIAMCEIGAKKVVDDQTGEVVEEAYTEVATKAF